jgi:hypothetical protein
LESEKKLTIGIPEKLHGELKVLAVIRKTTMREIVLDAIRREIEEEYEKTKE